MDHTDHLPRQLNALDLHLLDTETSATPMHIGAIILLDSAASPRGPLTLTALQRLFAERLRLVTPLRRRVRTVPFGLDLPYWEHCANVDLGYHVREVVLPDGVDDRQLAECVAGLHAQPLDRSRPLWECHLVTGLAGGRQAVYTKVHHAVIDGVSAAEIMGAILDATATPMSVISSMDRVPRERTPSTVDMLARSVPHAFTRPATRVRAVLRTLPTLRRAGTDLRAFHSEVPFNEPITSARTLAYTSLPLDAVKAVKNQIGGTVNDVVMALCTSALRRWMIDHDIPTERPLLAAMPVSVRTPEEFGTAGNRFSLMLGVLPVAEDNPWHRVKIVHDALLAAKARFRDQPPDLLREVTSLLTPLLHGLPTRTVLRAAASALPLVNLLVSNVPGPQIPLYLNGIRVLASYPVSVLTELSGGLNITVMSYDGHLDFGILACPDAIPDPWELARHLADSLTELQA
ncbi:wax ester/triacylglycerol synthase family O-acyltransferase [Nocardia sp. ET3-3]|uniref:Diacylglycerol O-acyltransferase n=1 Tax=Nocardia terrae TaxID=2675851 RepID=A0A7K1UVY5_9NOCA|nr:wax ester/triacylglycerol synthase family O-acyltransferase [Nocardia terrae]MVU78421.1 wax ester/triacylglycerol synthase family O-acyltransferase [Nocardia terrae]